MSKFVGDIGKTATSKSRKAAILRKEVALIKQWFNRGVGPALEHLKPVTINFGIADDERVIEAYKFEIKASNACSLETLRRDGKLIVETHNLMCDLQEFLSKVPVKLKFRTRRHLMMSIEKVSVDHDSRFPCPWFSTNKVSASLFPVAPNNEHGFNLSNGAAFVQLHVRGHYEIRKEKDRAASFRHTVPQDRTNDDSSKPNTQSLNPVQKSEEKMNETTCCHGVNPETVESHCKYSEGVHVTVDSRALAVPLHSSRFYSCTVLDFKIKADGTHYTKVLFKTNRVKRRQRKQWTPSKNVISTEEAYDRIQSSLSCMDIQNISSDKVIKNVANKLNFDKKIVDAAFRRICEDVHESSSGRGRKNTHKESVTGVNSQERSSEITDVCHLGKDQEGKNSSVYDEKTKRAAAANGSSPIHSMEPKNETNTSEFKNSGSCGASASCEAAIESPRYDRYGGFDTSVVVSSRSADEESSSSSDLSDGSLGPEGVGRTIIEIHCTNNSIQPISPLTMPEADWCDYTQVDDQFNEQSETSYASSTSSSCNASTGRYHQRSKPYEKSRGEEDSFSFSLATNSAESDLSHQNSTPSERGRLMSEQSSTVGSYASSTEHSYSANAELSQSSNHSMLQIDGLCHSASNTDAKSSVDTCASQTQTTTYSSQQYTQEISQRDSFRSESLSVSVPSPSQRMINYSQKERLTQTALSMSQSSGRRRSRSPSLTVSSLGSSSDVVDACFSVEKKRPRYSIVCVPITVNI